MLKDLLAREHRLFVFGSKEGFNRTLFHIKMCELLNEHFGDNIPVTERILDISFACTDGRHGVDQYMQEWARYYGFHCEVFPIEWDKYKSPNQGNPAAFKKAAEIANYVNLGAGFWNGNSKEVPAINDILVDKDIDFITITVRKENG